MGGHHKKNLRAEKAKVKLKGAKLPKGLNVTKTEFKVRKITIREQLKESQYVDGQRLVNLKETLSRLKHHSSTFRMEALRNLKENLAAGDTKIMGHLNQLTQGISAISLDLDKDTRRESFKVLSSFLAALPSDAIEPFFHIISSYLRCAMTHIQPAIQEDSLLMLDVLLLHVPHLVAANSGKIFQNFLEMISKVRAEGDKAGRMLTVNMGNKQTTIKWRSKILQRLHHMLNTLANHNRQRTNRQATNGHHLFHTFNNKEPQYFTLIRSLGNRVCDLSQIFCKSIGDSSSSNFVGSDVSAAEERQILQRYVEHLMPLLVESWLEVRPQPTSTHGNCHMILSYDAAVTLKVVLEIIENLWTLVDIHDKEVNYTDLSTWFRKEYADTFAQHFLQSAFPYQQMDNSGKEHNSGGGRKKSKNSNAEGGGQFCIEQNINVAYIMSLFYAENMEVQGQNFGDLLKYLSSIVRSLKSFPLESFIYLEKALRSHLCDNGAQNLKYNSENTRMLLTSTITAFLGNQFPKDGVSPKILVLLCDIVQKRDLFTAYGEEIFNEFLVYLPQLLLRPTITEQALISMSNLGKQKNAIFANALQQIIKPVIENIQKIQVQGARNAFEGKKHIMNLFYWLECDWNSEVQGELIKKVEENVPDKRIAGYFSFIIRKV